MPLFLQIPSHFASLSLRAVLWQKTLRPSCLQVQGVKLLLDRSSANAVGKAIYTKVHIGSSDRGAPVACYPHDRVLGRLVVCVGAQGSTGTPVTAAEVLRCGAWRPEVLVGW